MDFFRGHLNCHTTQPIASNVCAFSNWINRAQYDFDQDTVLMASNDVLNWTISKWNDMNDTSPYLESDWRASTSSTARNGGANHL